MLKNLYNTIFVNTFKELESQKTMDSALDKKVIIVFITTVLSLIFINYFGQFRFLLTFLKSIELDSLANTLNTLKYKFPNEKLFKLCYWASIVIIFYLFVPILVIKVFLKEKLGDYGLSPKGFFGNYNLYLIIFLLLVPIILLASTTESFQHSYPFYKPRGESLWPNFVIWQCFYFVQFLALEFFYRGFLIHGIKNRFGFYSLFVMIIPYVMIHFEKPMPETLGAIFAGFVLGTLSLKSRSIWLGVAIHYSVAITMDLAALWQKGYFG